MPVDRKRAESAMAEFLSALGHEGAELSDTPQRVTDAYADELLSGYGVNIESVIVEGSELLKRAPDPILIDGIAVATVCPHHLLLAQGKALVAYVPGQRVLGLGTIARVVNACSRRLVLQEEIASNVTDALMQYAGAKGAFCRISLDHACLQARGAREPSAMAVTWSGKGELNDLRLLESVLGRPLPGLGTDSP